MKLNQKYIEDINFLESRGGLKRAKYRRNLRTYYHTYGFGMTNISDTAVAGYYSSSATDIEEDTSSGIQENVIKSCIDTLVSKIASQKVNLFFNTVNAQWKELQITRQLQQFFDNYFDNKSINKLVADVFRDAAIFDTGVIYIDPITLNPCRILPWQINFDNREHTYQNLTRISLKMENYPISLLPIDKKYIKDKDLSNDVTYIRYWNLLDHKFVEYIPDLDYYNETAYDKEVLPFLFLFYEEPIKSGSTVSIVDQLWGLQEAIDALLVKIKDASQLASPLKYFIPEQSTIKVKKLSNRTGEIITYTALPNQTNAPIVTATEPFMDPQWQQLLDKFKQDAYEICGISQLSATSQKPKGLNSGIALTNMEEIESDRFETQLNSATRLFKYIANLYISLADDDESILPNNSYRKDYKWFDVKQVIDSLQLQSTAADGLSKDPATKAQQIAMLVQTGAIPQSRVASLLEIPDASQGYSLVNNAVNAVMRVIDDCIDEDKYDIPDFIPSDMLKSEIISTMLSLYAGSNADEYINKLKQLFQAVIDKEVNSMSSAEMFAVQSLQQEMMQGLQQDLNDPHGQINTAIQDGISNNTEELTQQVMEM